MKNSSQKQMTSLVQYAARSIFSDRINPVFIKEMRQESRSKSGIISWVTLLLFLGLWYYSTLTENGINGAEDFYGHSFFIQILCFLPLLRLLGQWNNDRENDYLILENTALTVTRILNGKLLAGICLYGMGFLIYTLFYLSFFFKISRQGTFSLME